jgi:hypothetical protein
MSAAAMTSSPKISPHFLKAFVRGEHRGRVLVAARHQLKEEHRPRTAEREVADLVDDEQRRMRQYLQPRL